MLLKKLILALLFLSVLKTNIFAAAAGASPLPELTWQQRFDLLDNREKVEYLLENPKKALEAFQSDKGFLNEFLMASVRRINESYTIKELTPQNIEEIPSFQSKLLAHCSKNPTYAFIFLIAYHLTAKEVNSKYFIVDHWLAVTGDNGNAISFRFEGEYFYPLSGIAMHQLYSEMKRTKAFKSAAQKDSMTLYIRATQKLGYYNEPNL